MQERITDYLNFGVRYVWLIDPVKRLTFVHTPDGIQEVRNGLLSTRNPDIEVSLHELE